MYRKSILTTEQTSFMLSRKVKIAKINGGMNMNYNKRLISTKLIDNCII